MTSFRDRAANFFRRYRLALTTLVLGLLLGALLRPAPEPASPAPAAATATPSGGAEHVTDWTCAMHPQIHAAEPGLCPICGMELVPVSAGNDATDTGQGLVLSDRARTLAKLRTSPVRRELAAAEEGAGLRLLGRFELDETTMRAVTAWTGGRIERLHVRATGQKVAAGQVVATLYSPEVLAAHQDLIVAKGQADKLAAAPPASQTFATQALAAARARLQLLGVPDAEIQRLETQTTPTRSVAIRSPYGGTVLSRVAEEGAYVAAGGALYQLANLGQLWLQLDAYESDLAMLAVGQDVRVEVTSLASDPLQGKVMFIDPTLDAQKRTARVRVAVPNPSGQLRPGMFAHAVVELPGEEGVQRPLVVPATAVLFTGRRSVVYVETASEEGQSSYEPRTVRLGPRAGDSYPVVSGLVESERIVTRGAFALDADLQIRGGPSMMGMPDDRAPQDVQNRIQLKPAERELLVPIVEEYLRLQKALAEDDLHAAHLAVRALLQAASPVRLQSSPEALAAWKKIDEQLQFQGARLVAAESLESARAGFEGISDALREMLVQLGNPLERDLIVAHCPMAFGSKGAFWLQAEAELANSYFGESMRSCGEVSARVPGHEFFAPVNPGVGAGHSQ